MTYRPGSGGGANAGETERCGVALRDQGAVARAASRPPSRLRGGALTGPGGGARPATGGVSPGGSPTHQRAPSAPAGGGRGTSRPGGPAAPRGARADRESQVAAWGVGRPSAALPGARTGGRTGDVGLGHPVGGGAPTRRAATATGTRSRGGSQPVREMRSARVVMVFDLRRGEGMAYS
jgi:hypothetical protein